MEILKIWSGEGFLRRLTNGGLLATGYCFSYCFLDIVVGGTLAFFHRGGRGGAPLRQFAPPEIWSENNRKISITKEICITIDFAPLEKMHGRKPGTRPWWRGTKW